MSAQIINHIIDTYFKGQSKSDTANLKKTLEHLQREAKKSGVELAVAIAGDYDKYSSHTHRVGDCILAKLKYLNPRYIRRNVHAKANAEVKGEKVKVKG